MAKKNFSTVFFLFFTHLKCVCAIDTHNWNLYHRVALLVTQNFILNLFVVVVVLFFFWLHARCSCYKIKRYYTQHENTNDPPSNTIETHILLLYVLCVCVCQYHHRTWLVITYTHFSTSLAVTCLLSLVTKKGKKIEEHTERIFRSLRHFVKFNDA